MAVESLVPNALTLSSGYSAQGGAATVLGAISDTNLATYAKATVAGNHLKFTFEDWSDVVLAYPDYKISSVVVYAYRSGSATTTFGIEIGSIFGTIATSSQSAGTTTNLYQREILPNLYAPRLIDLLDGLYVDIDSGGTSVDLRVYDVWVQVTFDYAPISTITNPVPGTITDTNIVPVNWDYADPEGAVQEKVQVKIVTDALHDSVGFDIETASGAGVLLDFTSFSDITGIAGDIPPLMTNHTTYHWYVRTSDAGSGGRWGPWDTVEATIELDEVAPATLDATADDANARVQLVVDSSNNRLDGDTASFENDLGVWTTASPPSGSGSNTTATHSTGEVAAASGTSVLKMQAIAAGNLSVGTPAGNLGYATAPGQTHSLMISGRRASVVTQRPLQFRVYWFKADGSASTILPNGVAVAASTTVTNTGWTVVQGIAVAPSDAAFMQLVVLVATVATGDVYYIDKVKLAPGNLPTMTWTRGDLASYLAAKIERAEQLADGSWSDYAEVRTVAQDVDDQWVDVREAFLDESTQHMVAYDYEAPRGVNLRYRVRIQAVVDNADATFSGVSDYSALEDVALTRSSCVWIKDPLFPQNNMQLILDQHSIPIARSRAQGIHFAEDRPDPIIVHGTIHKGSFPVVLHFTDDDTYTAWLALQDSKRTLLLDGPYGNRKAVQIYFVVGPEVQEELLTTDRMTLAQPRSVSFTAIEKAAP